MHICYWCGSITGYSDICAKHSFFSAENFSLRSDGRFSQIQSHIYHIIYIYILYIYICVFVSLVVEGKKCLNPKNGRKLILISVDAEFSVE